MSVGVMEDYKLRDLRASHTLGRGTGRPKDKDEVNKREVCAWVSPRYPKKEIGVLTTLRFGRPKQCFLK
jgi:hypothetical protein